ncbi:MAG: ABC-2 type transport system ATP-binding protein [Phycisphaerales bacterium]|jgi:ABC-2 type transport system ATP-binding protein
MRVVQAGLWARSAEWTLNRKNDGVSRGMIQTREIRVDYGEVNAVADLSLDIGPGEIYGLIGPNGAGKTSLISVLATLREPTYGDAKILGMDIIEDVAGVRRVLGYMPDMAPVYKDLKCWEFLDLFARAYFVSRHERRARVNSCLDEVSLGFKRDAKAGTLSRGMTQRLVLAKTLLHDPKVLLLDEPASGLDPIARIELRDLLRRQKEMGKAVVISSHILNELSEFCTSIGIMEKGRMVLQGGLDDIVAGLNETRRFVVETIGAADPAVGVLGTAAGVSDIETEADASGDGRCTFELAGNDEEAAALLSRLMGEGVRVKGFFERRRGVEDVMMRVGASEIS